MGFVPRFSFETPERGTGSQNTIMIRTITILLCMFPFFLLSQNKTPKHTLKDQAAKKFEEQDYLTAIELWTKAIKQDGNCIDCYERRGDCRFNLHQNADAMRDYTYAIDHIKHSCKEHGYWMSRAMLKRRISDTEGAIEDLSMAITICKKCVDYESVAYYYTERAEIYHYENRDKEAIKDLEFSIGIDDPNSKYNAYGLLALIYNKSLDDPERNYPKAIYYMNKIIEGAESGLIEENGSDYYRLLGIYDNLINQWESDGRTKIPSYIIKDYCLVYDKYKKLYPDHFNKEYISNKNLCESP